MVHLFSFSHQACINPNNVQGTALGVKNIKTHKNNKDVIYIRNEHRPQPMILEKYVSC